MDILISSNLERLLFDLYDEDDLKINELYHKSQKEGLTAEEKEEQQILRKEYIAAIRGNIESQLQNVSLVGPNGVVTPVTKIKK